MCNCYRSASVSSCAVINCNNKTQNGEVSYFLQPKDTSVHKDSIRAAGCQVDILSSKISICSNHFEEKYFDARWKLQNEQYY